MEYQLRFQIDEQFFTIPSKIFIWNVLEETTEMINANKEKSFQKNYPYIEISFKSFKSVSFLSTEIHSITIQLKKRKLSKIEDLPFYIILQYQPIQSTCSIRRNDPLLSVDYSKCITENKRYKLFNGTYSNQNVIIKRYESIKYEQEIKLVKQFFHENIIFPIATYFEQHSHTCVVFPSPTYRLDQCYLQYSLHQQIQIIKGIINALQYLHEKN